MNHPPLTASHAAFFGRWLLVCIGACFLASLPANYGSAPLFIPQMLPLGLFCFMIAGQFPLLGILSEKPMHTGLGCLALPICIYICGAFGVYVLSMISPLALGSSWWANLIQALIWGGFFGLCQLVAMPPLSVDSRLWPLCTAVCAAIGLGALYLIAPEVTTFGPSLNTTAHDGLSNTQWGDLIPLSVTFGSIFGITSGAALTWMLRQQITSSGFSSFYGIELILGVIIGILGFRWAYATNTTIFPSTRPDDFVIAYQTSNSQEHTYWVTQDTCSYGRGQHPLSAPVAVQKIAPKSPLASHDRDMIFQALRDAHIDHFPYLVILRPLAFDLSWNRLVFTMDGKEYEIRFEAGTSFSDAQQSRLQHVLDTMAQICKVR